MDYGIDDRFTKRNRVNQFALLPFLRGNFGKGFVLDRQFIQNLFGCLDKRAVAVLLVFDQINAVKACIFGNLYGKTI